MEKDLSSLSEQELIRKIITEPKGLFHFFNFVIEPALGLSREGWDYQLFCGVEREVLGLPKGEKPGDIDILIIPCRNHVPHPDLMAAIEVKVLRLPVAKRHKDTASSGVKQAKGLVRDGFPFAGILHLILAEPSPKEDWRSLKVARVIHEETGEVEILPDERPYDPIINDGAERQFGRLRKNLEGTCIGFHAVGLIPDIAVKRIKGTSVMPGWMATRNPNVNSRLLDAVRSLFPTKPSDDVREKSAAKDEKETPLPH